MVEFAVSGQTSRRETPGPLMQCAWCRRFYDHRGPIDAVTSRRLENRASHGICFECADALSRRREQAQRAAGDRRGAERTARNRTRSRARVIRERARELRARATVTCERARALLDTARFLVRSPGGRA